MTEDMQNQGLGGAAAQLADSERPVSDEPDQTGSSPRRPFEDAADLNSIPAVRPEDPPYRDWWVGEDNGDEPKG